MRRGNGAVKIHLKVPSETRFAVLGAFVGLAAGFAISFLLPPAGYTAKSAIWAPDGIDLSSVRVNEAAQHVMRRNTLKPILTSEALYQAEMQSVPIEDLVERMRRNTRIKGSRKLANAFEIEFDHEDPAKSQRAVNAIVQHLAGEIRLADRRLEFSLVVARTPPIPFSSRGLPTLLGLLGGTLVGLAAHRLLRGPPVTPAS